MVSLRSLSSSGGPSDASRWWRLSSEICRVVAVIVRNGRRTRPATNQPSAMESDGHDAEHDQAVDEEVVQVGVALSGNERSERGRAGGR